jgi:hypothetical protein
MISISNDGTYQRYYRSETPNATAPASQAHDLRRAGKIARATVSLVQGTS